MNTTNKATLLAGLLVVVLLSVLLPAANASATTLSVGGGIIGAVDATTAVHITLDSVPAGLSGYTMTVSLSFSGPDVADITGVTFPGWASLNDNSGIPGNSVWMKAADLNNTAGTTDIDLGTLEITAKAEGECTFHVRLDGPQEGLWDDDENTIVPDITDYGTIRVDLTPPTVSSATAVPDPAKAGVVTVTVVFSETTMDTTVAPTVEVTGLNTDPYTVTQSSYVDDTWTGTFTLLDEDETKTATISVSGAIDTAGHTMTANPTAGTFTVDTVEPTVTITDDEAGTANIAGGDVTYTFTFSEAVTGFNASDVTVANGTKGTFTAVRGTQYTLVVTPTPNFEGDMTVDVGASAAVDAAGNGNTAATQSVQPVDTKAPTATVDIVDASLNDTDNSSVVNFTFSEATTDFDAGDLTVVGGAISGFSGSGTSYTATFTATDGVDTTGSVTVDAGSYTDAAGNLGSTGQDTVAIDTLNPTATVDIVDASLNDTDNSSVVNFTFSEATTDFDAGDLTVVGGAISGFSGSGTSYTATFTATDGVDTTGSVTVDAGSYTDAAVNVGATGQDTVAIDTLNPTVTTVDDTDFLYADRGNAVPVTVTFSEDMDQTQDLTVTDGGADDPDWTIDKSAGWQSATTYQFTYAVPDSDHQLADTTFEISGGKDLAGNSMVAKSQQTTIDTVKPAVLSASATPDPAKAGTVTVTVVFTGGVAMDTTVAPTVTVTGLADATPYTVHQTSYTGNTWIGTFNLLGTTPEVATGTISVAGAADTAGNVMLPDAAAGTFDVDTVNPKVTSVTPASLADADAGPVTVDITFDEPMTQTDILTVTVQGITGSPITVAYSSWTSSTVWQGTFPFVDNDELVNNAYYAIAGAQDVAGNTMVPLTARGVNNPLDVDTLNPTVTTVTIASNNANDASLAKVGDEITVTFTASEALHGTPTATIATNVAVVAATANPDEYSAKYTMQAGDTEGVLPFTIDFDDLAGNPGTQVTATTDAVSVTFDETAPVTTAGTGPSDRSNDADPSFTFTATDTGGTGVASSQATLSGAASAGPVVVTSPFNLSTVLPGGLVTNGAYTMSVVSTDNAGNVESTATWTWTYDSVAPTLPTATIASSNANTALAKVSDTVTLTIVSDEDIKNVAATIDTKAAAIVAGTDAQHWTAAYVMQTGDTEDVLPFTIEFDDSAGSAGAQVTATTDGSSVTFDKTPPTLTTVSIASDNDDPTLAIVLDTVTLSFTADETLIGPPVVMIDGNAADAVNELGGNAYTATREMQVGDTEGVIAFTIDFTDAVGNPGVQVTATTDASSVTFEETLPIIPGPHGVPPTDPDGDGLYEDLNGNGILDFADVVLFFNEIEWIASNESVTCFDFNQNERIDYDDVVTLFDIVP